MITATAAVKEMLETAMHCVDAHPTEKQLKAMTKEAFKMQPVRTMDRQRQSPEQREMHRMFNLA